MASSVAPPDDAPRLRSPADLRAWVAADVRRYCEDGTGVVAVAVKMSRTPQLRWLVRLRITELAVNAGGVALRPLAALLRWRLQAKAVRLGYTIGVNVCGPGLRLPHWGTIVVSSYARVGPGCTLHPGTCLGARYGKAPRLAANVYVGPGAKLYGAVNVGEGATIGANAVVNRDVAEHTVVAGAPARPIHGIAASASREGSETTPSPSTAARARGQLR